ncbi:unnamed protein product [marine sediment metagenome]|uniref:Uncharacterized protein n=1 Tax=marine sediment metagenome TaxID=412755 RepID=X0U721_9ZZZZ
MGEEGRAVEVGSPGLVLATAPERELGEGMAWELKRGWRRAELAWRVIRFRPPGG